jgi:hypothetical protein
VINKYQCSNTGVIAARGKRKRNNEWIEKDKLWLAYLKNDPDG